MHQPINRKKVKYSNPEWQWFAARVKERDGNLCTTCYRSEPDVILQVHHKRYIKGRQPWEYALDDCITLCKGCHAREHNLLPPDSDWILIGINDLGLMDGKCERQGCHHPIRYEHAIYHPEWGYMTVGSSCAEQLTNEDQRTIRFYHHITKQIDQFLALPWSEGKTREGEPYQYIHLSSQSHEIRIYADRGYSFQVNPHETQKQDNPFNYTRLTNFQQVATMAFITLKRLLNESKFEKKILGDLYISVKDGKSYRE